MPAIHLTKTMPVEQFHHAHSVVLEVLDERMSQHAKWGQQNWPDFPADITDLAKRADFFGIPTEDEAKADCEVAFEKHRGTYGHILVEEVAEVFGTTDQASLRQELIQCAAVCTAWVEKIDRDIARADTAYEPPEEG